MTECMSAVAAKPGLSRTCRLLKQQPSLGALQVHSAFNVLALPGYAQASTYGFTSSL